MIATTAGTTPAVNENASLKPVGRKATKGKRQSGRAAKVAGQATPLKIANSDDSTTMVREPAGKSDRQPAKSLPEVIDADLAARHFRVTLRTWRRWDSAGRIPLGFKIGGRKLWRATDLESWANWGFPKRDDFVARLRVEAEDP